MCGFEDHSAVTETVLGRVSQDSGTTWSPVLSVSSVTSGNVQGSARVSANAGFAALIWRSATTLPKIYFNTLTITP